MATRPGKDHVVGVDIGGTGTKGALVDVKAGKLAAPRALPTPIVLAQLLNDAGIIRAAMFAQSAEFATKS